MASVCVRQLAALLLAAAAAAAEPLPNAQSSLRGGGRGFVAAVEDTQAPGADAAPGVAAAPSEAAVAATAPTFAAAVAAAPVPAPPAVDAQPAIVAQPAPKPQDAAAEVAAEQATPEGDPGVAAGHAEAEQAAKEERPREGTPVPTNSDSGPPAIESAPAPLPKTSTDGGSDDLAASATGALLSLSAFFWNVHWQCSVAARGSSGACRERAAQRFRQLAGESGAAVVASVELSYGMSHPMPLMTGWTQADGSCARGDGGDSAALAFAPGWQVEATGGGCLRHDYDTRAFAVARVVPPTPVQGCPKLCVVALHAPHSSITTGRDTINGVCGEATQSCVVAMGDWNVDAGNVQHRWGEMVSGGAPALIAPNERTCCFPEWQHYGWYDHIATNIPGAWSEGYTVHPYQITEENPWEQHRPVSARLALPAAL